MKKVLNNIKGYLQHPQLIDMACMLSLVILGLIVYLKVLNFDFVLLDDDNYLTDEGIKSGFGLSGIIYAFTNVVNANWHPVTVITFQIDRSIYGGWPGGYHLTNVLLHIINSLFLYKIFRLLGASLFISIFCASIFAIHPINVESVAWVSERKGLLSAFFLLLALLSYIYYIKDDVSKKKWYWLSVIAFAFSVMSKASTVTFPILLLLLDYWPLQRFKSNNDMVETFKRLIIEKWPFFLASVLVTIITVLVHDSSGALKLTHSFGMDARLLNYFVSLQKYLVLILYPQDLIVFYPYRLQFSIVELIIGLSIFIIISFISFWLIKRQPFIFVGWGAFLVLWLPVAGFLQTGGHAYADRYMYLPMIGILFLVAWLLQKIKHSLLAVVLILVVGTALTVTLKQVTVWKNTETLFKHALTVVPDNFPLSYNLMLYYLSNQQWHDGIRQYQKSKIIFPKSIDLYDLASQILYDGGQVDEAAKILDDAVEALPDNAYMHRKLGKIKYKQKEYSDAVLSFRKAVELDKMDVESIFFLGMSQLKLLQYEDAYTSFINAEKISPSSVHIQIKLGEAALAAGNELVARKHFLYALKLSPDNAYVKYRLQELDKKQ